MLDPYVDVDNIHEVFAKKVLYGEPYKFIKVKKRKVILVRRCTKCNKLRVKKEGWYITTVEVKGQQRYVMMLYWYPKRGKWIDNIRQDVFDTYDVYGYSTTEKSKLYTIPLCDRTDSVIAWKERPKTYMKGFIKEN